MSKPARDDRPAGKASRWLARLATVCCLLLPAAAPCGEPSPVRVAPGVYAFIGRVDEPSAANAGRVGNAGFIVGPRGVVVVDTGISRHAGREMLAAIARTTQQPVRLAILTQARQEFIFGAEAFRARGIPVLAHQRAAELMQARCQTCLTQLTETLGAAAMAGSRVPLPDWQIAGSLTLTFTGRSIELIAFEHAASPGDLAVFDRASGVLFAGGLVQIGRVPELRDGKLAGWLAALDALGQLPVRRVVPGFGPVQDAGGVRAARAYLADLREAVAARYRHGASLTEAIRQAELPSYGAWSGYAERQPLNVQNVYLTLEREEF